MNENSEENFLFDAFTYGVEPAGLRSKGQINMIICYTIAKSKAKLTEKIVTDTMVEGEIANYFEVKDAFSRLYEKKLISADKNGYLEASPFCNQLIELVEMDLPYTIREKSVKIATKLAGIEIFNKENEVTITPSKSGSGFEVVMHISERDVDFMQLSLHMPTMEQAEVVKAKFIEKPVEVYNNLIDSIFSSEE